MSTEPAPDDDIELDFEQRRRVREALRDVPAQAPQVAALAVETAMSHWVRPTRRRQPLWLLAGAAAVVGVLGVVAVSRPDTTSPGDIAAQPAATEMSSATEMNVAGDVRMAGAPTDAGDLEPVRALVRTAPTVDATCPLEGDERSFGTTTWSELMVEVLADAEANTLRVVDATTCEVLVQVPLTP